MPSSTVCWGIELGAGAVKAIKLEREGDDLKVLDYAIIPHKRVLSTPDIDPNEATRVALGTLVSQYDLTGASIAVSVPGHAAFARFAKLPPVERKKIPDIVKFEAAQQIPFPIDDVEWDYQTFQSEESPDVEVGIFAITRDRILERLTMWQDVGITPDYVTLSPVAAYNAVAWDLQFTATTPGTVILDVGTTSTDLIVAEAGRVWVRTFPIGGHNFTEALVDTFKLSYQKAERLKREAETSKHARHVFQAMRQMFGELANDVQRSIGYYQSLHREANLTRLIVLGSTFNLPGLRKYLGQQLQMEVVRLEQFRRLNVEGPRAAELQAATINMATAYGLALQGLGLQTIDANLMPKQVAREAMWHRKVKWFGVAAALAIAAGGVTFIKPMIEGASVGELPGEVASTKTQLQRLNSQWQQVQAKFAEKDARAANALLLLEDRSIYPFLMADVGQMMGGAEAELPEAAPQDALRFGRLDTEYMPPLSQEVDPYSDPDPAAAGDQPRRVQMTLQISTTMDASRADEFVTRAFKQWLTTNAEREGVPYRIESPQWRMVESREARQQPGGQPERPGMRPPSGGRGNRGPIGGDGIVMPNQPGGGSAVQSPEGRPPRGVRGPGSGGTGTPGNLDQIAPLDGLMPEPTDAVIRTYEVTWEAVIVDEDTNAEEQS